MFLFLADTSHKPVGISSKTKKLVAASSHSNDDGVLYCDHSSVMAFESSKQGEKGGERVREESKTRERRKIPEDTREGYKFHKQEIRRNKICNLK